MQSSLIGRCLMDGRVIVAVYSDHLHPVCLVENSDGAICAVDAIGISLNPASTPRRPRRAGSPVIGPTSRK